MLPQKQGVRESVSAEAITDRFDDAAEFLARATLPIMKRILSEVLRRRNGVERRKGRAGALRIEFIERSRNESLGIECVFAVSDGEGVERSEGLEDGVLASGARPRDTDGRLETFLQRCDQSQTEIDRGSDQSRGRRRERSPWLRS